jgi:hypothetical protein
VPKLGDLYRRVSSYGAVVRAQACPHARPGSETVGEYLVADEPETIAAGLEGNCNAFDWLACLAPPLISVCGARDSVMGSIDQNPTGLQLRN